MKDKIKKWLGVSSLEDRIEVLETLLLHKDSRILGFGVLKKHLQRTDRPLPNFNGKPIEQD